MDKIHGIYCLFFGCSVFDFETPLVSCINMLYVLNNIARRIILLSSILLSL